MKELGMTRWDANTKTMVAHSSTISHVCVFADALAKWLEAPWNVSIKIPYVIASVEDWMVIFDLCFLL